MLRREYTVLSAEPLAARPQHETKAFFPTVGN
jgi:hypothetical protein